jgi:tRNA A-37 threonylcarbamoyl transferase component Bud32
VLVTTYFAFVLFAVWVVLQYGVKTTDFGWQVQRLGDSFYVSAVHDTGPASGSLRAGDRIIAINGEPISSESGVSLALRSVASSSLYTVRVQRDGEVREIWLRSRTHAGFSFFRERLPLVGSSLLIFFAGLAMLFSWNSVAARFGFVASICTALRMGCWGILPLSTFFRPEEFHPFFLFWLPVGLGLPLAYQATISFTPEVIPSRQWRIAGWAFCAMWVMMQAPIVFGGATPAPVPEGVAFVFWDHIEYRQISPLLRLGAPMLLALCLGGCAAWVRKLWLSKPDEDLRRRLMWMTVSGALFAIPAGAFEVAQWYGANQTAVRWGWLPAMMAIAFSYLLTAERVTHPLMVIRSVVASFMPERIFRWLDKKFFPSEAEVEENLEQVIADIEGCRQIERLNQVLSDGLDRALAPAGVAVNAEVPIEDMLDLGPKRNGEPYTRREQRLIRRALSKFQVAQHELPLKPKPPAPTQPADSGALNLMRECPRCGECYDSDVVRCPNDQQIPVVNLPIERIVDGKYRMERLIGRGGMGAVYAGRDIRLNRRIAIKLMLSELFGQESALRRFEREAQLAALLNHPNVVQIYDCGPVGAMGAYLVMEYIEGRSWREELVTGGTLSPAACLSWIAQLLDGVEAAHASGIIHRDLKPENLLLAERDDGGPPHLKILDFGLAKMQLLRYSFDEKLSLGIRAIGTIGYVPQEQVTGGAVDERSDIYAIGRIIIETLTGSLPESGAGDVPSPLHAVLTRCVQMKRDDRYASIAELRRDLIPALEAAGTLTQTYFEN